MKNNKLYIIIPIYNVGSNYINKCLLSIYHQNLSKNLYILIVNDKSLKWEEEKQIIEQYKNKLNIIVIENIKNLGLGPSRNVGLNYIKNNIHFSHCDYILFIDSDDFLKKKSLKKILKKIERTKCPDIIRFSYISLEKDRMFINYRPTIFSENQENKKMWNGFFECSWLCAYNIKFIFDNNLFFKNSKKIHEDVYYSLITSCLAESIVSTNIYVYIYRWNRDGSITSIYNENLSTETKLKWIRDMTYYIYEAYNFVKQKVEIKKIRFYFSKFNWVLTCWKLDNLNINLYEENAKTIEKIFNSLNCDFFDKNKNLISFDNAQNFKNYTNNKIIIFFERLKAFTFNKLVRYKFFIKKLC